MFFTPLLNPKNRLNYSLFKYFIKNSEIKNIKTENQLLCYTLSTKWKNILEQSFLNYDWQTTFVSHEKL